MTKIELLCVQRQRRWAAIETTLAALAASESDIETSVTVYLPLCQCQSSASSAEPGLTQHMRHW